MDFDFKKFLVWGALSSIAAVPLAAVPLSVMTVPALIETALLESILLDVGDRVIVVLKTGDEVIGEVVEENDDKISVKSAFGVTSIQMDRVESVIRGEEVDRREYSQRKKRATRRGSASGWFSLGQWARERGLKLSAREAFEKALQINPEHESSKIALGWGKIEDLWKTPAEAEELIAKGWERDGVLLTPPSGKTPPTPDPVAEPTRKPPVSGTGGSARPTTPDSVRRRLGVEEIARREELLEKRRKNRERFEENKRKEYEGVPWSQRSIIKSKNWIIECNSTPEVARTYQWIMEQLYATLGKIFKSPDVRSQKPLVKIYRTHDEFMLKTGMGGGIGGFYNPGSQNVTAFHGTFGLTGTTYTVLAHEGTHAFQGKKMPRMGNYPNWFIEGLAVYFGDGSKLDYKKKKLVSGLIPRDRLFHIQEKMREGTHTILSKLGGLPKNRFGGTHYADSWAVMHYLINGPESRKGQRFLAEYWVAGEKRRVGQRQFNDLAKKYFNSVHQMEADWKAYTLDLKPDPAGEVEGDTFTSLDFMFSIDRPNEQWKFAPLEIEDRDLVLMKIPETRNEIRVRILSKAEADQRSEDWIDSVLLTELRKKYTNVETLKGDLGGLDAFVFQYTDRPPEKPKKSEDDPDGSKTGDPKPTPAQIGGGSPLASLQQGTGEEDPKDGEAVDSPKPSLRKHRSYVLVGVSNAYELRGSFELEQFDNWLPDLEWVAFSFEKIQKNRW
ncbi:MAG: DUF1570 domain-containing protein [Planctomycetota bacterium]|nr:DUF1570 domain-containing protein [Planctomycetota bacterium]